MASSKLVMFFKDQTGYGWSESFYYGPGFASPNLVTDVQDLVNARAAILTNSCLITHVRVSTATKRLPIIFQLAGGVGKPGGETPPTAPSEVALLVSLQALGVGYLRPFLRGIPERVVAADAYFPDPTFTANLNQLSTELVSGPWNASGTLGGSPTQFPVSSLLPGTPRGYSFITPIGSTFAGAVGSKIRMHGARVPGYNGIKVITQNPTGTHLFSVGGASPAANDNGVAPYVTQPGAFDSQITAFTIEGITRRGAGRPFGLSRGRKATLYSLRQ